MPQVTYIHFAPKLPSLYPVSFILSTQAFLLRGHYLCCLYEFGELPEHITIPDLTPASVAVRYRKCLTRARESGKDGGIAERT